jgi:hypothetical protein
MFNYILFFFVYIAFAIIHFFDDHIKIKFIYLIYLCIKNYFVFILN